MIIMKGMIMCERRWGSDFVVRFNEATPKRDSSVPKACQEPIVPYDWLIMKTTLDLPDDLLIEAKAVEARRRITLKDMVAHALRREIMPTTALSSSESELYEVGPFGILRLKKRGDTVDENTVSKLLAEADEEEFTRAMELRSGK
jgi:hypothetical protein